MIAVKKVHILWYIFGFSIKGDLNCVNSGWKTLVLYEKTKDIFSNIE